MGHTAQCLSGLLHSVYTVLCTADVYQATTFARSLVRRLKGFPKYAIKCAKSFLTFSIFSSIDISMKTGQK